MQEFEKKDFAKILKKNALDGHRWMKSTDSSAVRVYDRNLGAFPVTIDLYSGYARVVDYSDGGMSDDDITVMMDLISRFLYVEKSRIVYLERKKREGREQHGVSDESLTVDVKENGLLFECELKKYTDTGLFLDQAATRDIIRSMSKGMRVLNLFSYTSAFSVYAAAGGAERTVSVDLSNVYSAWSRRNLDRNGFIDPDKYMVVASDAGAYLEKAMTEGAIFDIVIFDPPAFSNSHKAEDFDVQKDYLGYLYMISRILAPGGICLFSENLSGFRFARQLIKPWWKVQEITEEVRPIGFSSKRSGLRVWILKKTADMEKTVQAADRKSRNMEEDRKERRGQEKGAFGRERREGNGRKPAGGRRDGGWQRDGRRGDDRPSYSRDRGFRAERRDDRDGDRGYRPRDRYDDYRPRDRYGDDRRGGRRYDDRDRDYGRDGYGDRYGNRDSYQQRRDFPGRDGYDRPSYRRDDRESRGYGRRDDRRDWDNDTGRAYRSSYRRNDDGERRPYRQDRDDRRPYGQEEGGRRKRNAPKPYGYDTFMSTKKRDTADAFWLKNTEVQKYDDEDSQD